MHLRGLMNTQDNTISECSWSIPTRPPRLTRHRTERLTPGSVCRNSTPDLSIYISQTTRGVERAEVGDMAHGNIVVNRGDRWPKFYLRTTGSLAVLKAIEELPKDIRDSVGYSQPDAQSLVVSVAGEPIEPENGESCVTRVELKYWNTLGERGWPQQQDELDQPGGRFAEQVEWPVISIFGQATNMEEATFSQAGYSGRSQAVGAGRYPGRNVPRWGDEPCQQGQQESLCSGRRDTDSEMAVQEAIKA